MSKRTLETTICALCLTCTQLLSAQSRTIPEAVELARPGPFVFSRIMELSIVPFENAIKEADWIVVGVLTHPSVYLSEDQHTLYTDYTLRTSRPVIPNRAAARQDPQSSTVIIRTWGGETTIAGVPVKIHEENIRPLKAGRPYFLALVFNEDIGKYEIYGHGAYALEVSAGNRLKSSVDRQGVIDPALEDGDLEDVIRMVHERRDR